MAAFLAGMQKHPTHLRPPNELMAGTQKHPTHLRPPNALMAAFMADAAALFECGDNATEVWA
jgi:hypothetical protein